jgi:hypothetical protein
LYSPPKLFWESGKFGDHMACDSHIIEFCIFKGFVVIIKHTNMNTMFHCRLFLLQLQSFETELSVPKLSEKEGGNDTCRGVFIRAPAILEVGPDVEILADCPVPVDRPSITISFGEGTEVCILLFFTRILQLSSNGQTEF